MNGIEWVRCDDVYNQKSSCKTGKVMTPGGGILLWRATTNFGGIKDREKRVELREVR